MIHRFYSSTMWLAVVVLLLFVPFNATAQNRQASEQPEISFTVSMSKPYTHLLEVEMRVRRTLQLPPQVNLIMPVWTPGSYLIREFERNVQDFAAVDASGRA